MISIKNLGFSYEKEKETLKGINLEVKQGEIFGLLGPSGAGKSTLQKLIIGLLKGYKGSIEVFGKEIGKNGNDFEEIGVGFEFPNFYNKLSLIENLDFFGSLYKNQRNYDELLKEVGLYEDRNKRVEELSKGMKMRLNFCRARINNPKLIFLDEPTSGLDPVNASIMRKLILDEKKRGNTVFLTTHNMLTAEKVCDKIAFVVDGEIKVIDTCKNLMKIGGEKRVEVEYKLCGKIEKREFLIENLDKNEEFLNILGSGGVEEINTPKLSLEEVFIKVTGRSLK